MEPKDRKAWETEPPIPSGIYPVIDTDLARDNIENDLPAADLEDLRETPHPRSVRVDAAAPDHGKPTER